MAVGTGIAEVFRQSPESLLLHAEPFLQPFPEKIAAPEAPDRFEVVEGEADAAFCRPRQVGGVVGKTIRKYRQHLRVFTEDGTCFVLSVPGSRHFVNRADSCCGLVGRIAVFCGIAGIQKFHCFESKQIKEIQGTVPRRHAVIPGCYPVEVVPAGIAVMPLRCSRLRPAGKMYEAVPAVLPEVAEDSTGAVDPRQYLRPAAPFGQIAQHQNVDQCE